MTYFRREHQGGSIVTFIIVAVLLVGLFVLGAYALKQRGAHVAREKTDTSQQTGTNNGAPATLPGGNSTDTTQNQSQGTNDTSSGTTGGQSGQSSTGANGSSSTPSRQGGSMAALPQTGPAETLAATIISGIFTFAAAAYLVSRRQLARSRQSL